jgi:hypothetical protein
VASPPDPEPLSDGGCQRRCPARPGGVRAAGAARRRPASCGCGWEEGGQRSVAERRQCAARRAAGRRGKGFGRRAWLGAGRRDGQRARAEVSVASD